MKWKDAARHTRLYLIAVLVMLAGSVTALLVFMGAVAGPAFARDDRGTSPGHGGPPQAGAGDTIPVRVLSTDGCTNTPRAIRLIETAASEMGIAIDISRRTIRTQEEADQYRFIGSPTVQIDGLDLERDMRKHPTFRVTWRKYVASGVPPEALIKKGLEEARDARRAK